MNYQKPKGTRDILPSETRVWQFMEDTARKIAGAYNYKEIRTPTFEDSALYLRSVGDTSDIVSKEMYEFKDKADRNLALRPEGTAGVVRAVIENGLLNEALPLKTYYFSNCFRYENTQKGRYREFTQFGLECFGASTPQADAELIIMIKKYLDALGITDTKLLLNSIGCSECRQNFNKALREFANQNIDRLCNDCKRRAVENPLRMLDCKQDSCQDIFKNAPNILDYLCPECKQHFIEVCKILKDNDIDFIIEPKLVRGLDYYTKTVFEFTHANFDGKTLTVCAGGRYDNLVQEIGGKPTPALGVGIGLDRLYSILCEKQFKKDELIYIANMDSISVEQVLKIANALRDNGVNVEINLANRSFKAQLKYASSIASHLIVIGENELASGSAGIKDLSTGEIVKTFKFN